MVSKKYRGTAPRPDDWDQRGKALLKSFGGSVEKRDESIRQTLEGLKAIRYVVLLLLLLSSSSSFPYFFHFKRRLSGTKKQATHTHLTVDSFFFVAVITKREQALDGNPVQSMRLLFMSTSWEVTMNKRTNWMKRTF
jgi:hypothetical protein